MNIAFEYKKLEVQINWLRCQREMIITKISFRDPIMFSSYYWRVHSYYTWYYRFFEGRSDVLHEEILILQDCFAKFYSTKRLDNLQNMMNKLLRKQEELIVRVAYANVLKQK